VTNSDLLWLQESDVTSLVDLNDGIDALQSLLALEGPDSAANIPKALGTWAGGGTVHSLGSVAPAKGLAGFKTWANTPRGAQALFLMFDAEDGSIRAVIEAAALGAIRTAGICGLATRWLAAEEADTLAIIGTGRQALTQVAAISVVRQLARLRVFSPNPESRSQFASRCSSTFDFEVEECSSVEAAVADCPIVTLVTRAREPFLHANMLAKGTHVNAVGAILPPNAEFHQDLFERCDTVVVDSLADAKRNSRELSSRFGDEEAAWGKVRSLGQFIAAGQMRSADTDLSLFKAMGMGLSDMAIGSMVLQRALERGVGRQIAQPGRSAPTWRAGRAAQVR